MNIDAWDLFAAAAISSGHNVDGATKIADEMVEQRCIRRKLREEKDLQWMREHPPLPPQWMQENSRIESDGWFGQVLKRIGLA